MVEAMSEPASRMPSIPGSPPAALSANALLAIFNINDYADFADHEGLELVH
jgi:hypothetical protein